MKTYVYNPKSLDESKLPIIYCFNNGGIHDMLHAIAMAEDGNVVGAHICSSESFMLKDLGITNDLSGKRAGYEKHYPDGYVLQWIETSEAATHPGLMEAYKKNQAL